MKNIIPIVFFLYSSFILGQEIYYSPMTENMETGQKNIINRTISIGEETIVIKTETSFGYHFQTLEILGKKENQETIPTIVIYECTSPDGVYPSLLFVPQRKITTEILVIQPSFYDGTDDHYRFYIEAEQKPSQQ